MTWLFLAQIDPATLPAPEGIPAWVWAVLIAAGGFFLRDLWPWLKAKWERDDARAERHEGEQDERFLNAYEQTAKALESIAASIDMFARASTVTAFHLDEMRREIRALSKRETPSENETLLARHLNQEPTRE